MSAHFLLEACLLEVDLDTAIANLARLSADEIAEAFDEATLGNATEEEVSADLRARALKALTDIAYPGGASTNDGPRDVCTMNFGDQIWLLTGGMSAGDSPTDSYVDVRFLERLGVTLTEQTLRLDPSGNVWVLEVELHHGPSTTVHRTLEGAHANLAEITAICAEDGEMLTDSDWTIERAEIQP